VELNEEKTRVVDLSKARSFGFLGFDLREAIEPHGEKIHHSHADEEETGRSTSAGGRSLSCTVGDALQAAGHNVGA